MIHIIISNIILLLILFFSSTVLPIALAATTKNAAYGWFLYFTIPGGILLGAISLLCLNILNIVNKRIYLNLGIIVLTIISASFWFISDGHQMLK